MPSSFCSIEPHSSTTSYNKRPAMHTSRGGAGNIAPRNTATAFTQSTGGPSSTAHLNHNNSKSFGSGRGGFGNIHSSSEWAIFSFDEELEYQLRREKEFAPIFHVGRGGAGNMVLPDEYSLTRKRSDTGSVGSDATIESETQRTRETARRNLEKG